MVDSPGAGAFIGFAAQARFAQFVNAGPSTFHTLLFSFNPEDARDRSLLGRGVLNTSPFVGPFRKSVGALSPTHLAHLIKLRGCYGKLLLIFILLLKK